jgi:hypothetical protein
MIFSQVRTPPGKTEWVLTLSVLVQKEQEAKWIPAFAGTTVVVMYINNTKYVPAMTTRIFYFDIR